MKIFEVAGVGKLHGLTVMSLDAFVNDEGKEVDESDISGLMHAARNYNRSFLITAELAEGGKKTFRIKAQSEGVAREKFEQHYNQAEILTVKEEGIDEAESPAGELERLKLRQNAEHGRASLQRQAETQARIRELEKQLKDKEGVAEATSELNAELAAVYKQMAPGIEKHRDSFKAGQLYDALEAVAEKHGAISEFTRMCRGARNRAHMDYDTNPGGFENWFWYLPFADEEVSESTVNENASRLLSAEDRNGVITVVVQAPDGTKKSVSDENPRYVQQWLMKYDLRLPQSITSKFIESITEAPGDFGLGANFRPVSDEEMQAFLDRSKTKTKTKRDKFDYPYVHGSNIQVKDESGKDYDLEALKKEIMTRPKSILGQNAKMQHSETGEEAIFDIGLPALKGLAVNEKTGQFVVVDTCPGAGACQTYCYAMKGSYVMFKAVSMGLARMLNFLLNDPEGFAAKLNQEIAAAKAKYAKKGAKIVVRWHDAGDFFSPEYMDMAYSVAEANPDVGFYAYTKMGDVANAARPKNFNMNFSQGAKRGQEKKVDIVRTKHSKVVPKDMFFDLIARKGNELIKDAKGRMQFASPENLDKFKTLLAQKYAIDRDSILTYDQMMKIPVGDTPKWNVIVMPGDGDNSANRNDVIGSYLLFH